MGWLDFLRRPRGREAPAARADRLLEKMAELYAQLPDNYWPELDIVPFAHRPVFDYLQLCWSGVAPDPAFEARSLSRDFKMKGFNLSALFFLMALSLEVPAERVWSFLAPSVPGAVESTAAMFKKIMVMAESGMDEDRYLCGLAAGSVIDQRQSQYNRVRILAHVDNVAFLREFADVLVGLRSQQLHDAIDVKFGDILEDPGWRS
jgi:hypothetical protein